MFWGETDRNHLGYVIENILHRNPLSMDYDGSNCTCIHSPSLVSLIHLFHGTTDLKQQSCTLTHLQLLSCMRSYLLFPPVSLVHSHCMQFLIWISYHSTNELKCVNIWGWLLNKQPFVCGKRQKYLTSFFFFLSLCNMFFHSTLLYPYGFTVTHRGQRGLLIFSLPLLLIW